MREVSLTPTISPIYLCLCEQEFFDVLDRYNERRDTKFPITGGFSLTLVDDSNTTALAHIVCVSKDQQDVRGVFLASLLTHEAVHIWQAYVKYDLRTIDPLGVEQEAYGIHGIALELFLQYEERINKGDNHV